MTESSFDAVVIGSGLGGLTAGALMAKAGYSVCLLERNTSLGGAASCYKVGSLVLEASLHQTADPHDPREIKHSILEQLDLLDKITWLPAGDFFTIQGGPLGEPFSLPANFEKARDALGERFPASKKPVERVLGKMERICNAVAGLSAARDNRSLTGLLGALRQGYPLASGWRASLDEVFAAEFGGDEGLKFALAGNLPYYAADPKRLWWIFYALAQGGFLGAGGVYIQGGSRVLSTKLAGVIKKAGGSVRLGTAATVIETDASGHVKAVCYASRRSQATERIETRIVFANCAPTAIAAMLPKDAGSRFASAFASFKPSTSLFSAHFGLKTNPAQFGLRCYSTILLPDWMTKLKDYAGTGALLGANPNGKLPPLAIANYGAIDAGLDDGGPILVSVAGIDEIANWRPLSQSETAARREAWLDAIIGELERHYPGFAGAVVEKVFLSAVSMERYLGTPDGAIYGFDMTPPRAPIWAGMPRSTKTPVTGLYLASAFGGAGGYSGAMGAGSEAASFAKSALDRKGRAA